MFYIVFVIFLNVQQLNHRYLPNASPTAVSGGRKAGAQDPGLDIFHALDRISKLLTKTHGAFKPSMAPLREACFIVNLDDIKEASVVSELVLR